MKKRGDFSRLYVCPRLNRNRQRRDARGWCFRLGASRVWTGGGDGGRARDPGRTRAHLSAPRRRARLRGLVLGVGVETRAVARVRGGIFLEILQHPGHGGVVEGTRARRGFRLLDEPRVRRLGARLLDEHLLRLHLLQETNLSG